jgi:hypothetical protein
MLKLVQSDDSNSHVGNEVLIHVRYLSGGQVMTIDKCPPQLTAQEWRDLLLSEAGGHYRTFAGARGFFRLPRHVYDALLANVIPMAAE